MFESFGFESLTAPQAAIWFGVLLGLAFGAVAQVSRFCLRRAVVSDSTDGQSARAVWALALASTIVATQASIALGWLDFSEHRFFASEVPVLAIVAGGLLFGAGMVLARGCISRLTVLTGQGNLRALFGIIVFAVVAHATIKGVLAPLRTSLGGITLDLGATQAPLWTSGFVVALAIWFAVRARPTAGLVAAGIAVGLLATLGWIGTGLVLYDDFDPIALESLSFTSPMSEGLFWTIASTAIPAGFGTGLIGGVLLGSAIAALASGTARWESFTSPGQTGRTLFGSALMGVGGVLAGGCTVGAGLSGAGTLSVAAFLALGAIIAGGLLTDRLLSARPASGAVVPAE